MFVNGIQLEEYAKLEYGRLLWRVPEFRQRLLQHWNDPRHPRASPSTRPMCARYWKVPKVRTTNWTPNCASAT